VSVEGEEELRLDERRRLRGNPKRLKGQEEGPWLSPNSFLVISGRICLVLDESFQRLDRRVTEASVEGLDLVGQ
jgi:hypothetical protein